MNDRTVFWTIPNFLCVFRFAGSFSLIPIAIVDQPLWFVGLYLLLIITDLIDGPIARKFRQRSDIGARMDTIADLTLNLCLLLGVLIFCWDKLQNEFILLGGFVTSYCFSTAYGYWKYRRLLSYHTYLAKTAQWLAMLGAISLVLDWSVWPFRIAAIVAALGNIEAIAITSVLAKWRSDVPSIFCVWPPNKNGD